MQTELRILNGLHRGGILPLDESTLLIGSHEDADVVLVDPGMCDHHASLQKTDDGWMLTADGGPMFSTEQTSPQMLLDLLVGDFFRLGETWLVISDSTASWQAPPAIAREVDVLNDVDMAEPMLESVPSVDAEEAFDTSSEPLIEPVEQFEDAEPSLEPIAARRFKLPRWRKWMFVPTSLFALLSAVAAYAYTTKPSLPTLTHPEMPVEWRTDKFSRSLSSNDKAELPIRQDAESTKIQSVAVAKVVLPTPQVLQAAFRKRMKDADLLQRFDLDLTESAWSMRAHLDDEEGARFERILKAFVVEHKISFPISAKVGSAESMLPFQIRQIVTGTNAGIVTAYM